MTEEQVENLLRKYFHNRCSAKEEKRLMEIMSSGRHDREIKKIMDSLWPEVSGHYSLPSEEQESLYALIRARANEVPVQNAEVHRPIRRIHWMRYAAAVAVVVLAIIAIYFSPAIRSAKTQADQALATLPIDRTPGTRKAVLTLSNGSQVTLSEQGSRTITDGNLSIANLDGSLTYSRTDVMVYNTMSTPNGGEYSLVLPDGTKVWLNAASSITFPTAFHGNIREVRLTGEAYFEVVQNPERPFMIRTYKDDIAVLGTSLNVNCYEDEPIMKTSLVQGSVRIGGKVLQPGQAYVNGKIVQTDIQQDIAWKNGAFSFRNASLQTVMRQLARWYDVKVVYEGDIPPMTFDGEIGRTLTLTEALEGLTESRLKYRIVNDTIIIHP